MKKIDTNVQTIDRVVRPESRWIENKFEKVGVTTHKKIEKCHITYILVKRKLMRLSKKQVVSTFLKVVNCLEAVTL